MAKETKLQKDNRDKSNEERLLKLCRVSEDQSLIDMFTGKDGLKTDEVENRLDQYGKNVLARSRKTNPFVEILERFADPLVIQLLVIVTVSLFMGDIRTTTVIGLMIFLSVFVGYFQEKRSTKASEALYSMIKASVIVIREGIETTIPIEDVVPGDIIVLAAGSIIPADVRILSAKDFFVNQSTLTGESMPLEKRSTADASTDNELLQRSNAAFQGSTVVSGSARAIAVNTGSRTFLGSISQALDKNKDATNFDIGVKSFVYLMIRFMIVMVSLTFLIIGITKGDWVEALVFGLSVAVGLTPEMLPMIITVCLSKGAMFMSRKKVIVKKLKSIQNFGAMNILCTDKTGTLTQDRIILEKYVDVTNRTNEDALRYAYMNSYYQTGLHSLLDKSILSHEDLNIEKNCRKVDEIPFDFNRKRMSVVIAYEGMHVLICKGDVEEIYASCDRYQIDDDINPMIDIIRHDLLEEYQRLSNDGYRVLAVAYREFETTKEVFSVDDEKELILLGYVAFFDPPKDSAAQAIEDLKEAGVRVKILTGDNDLVTRKVCHDVGIGHDRVVTGRELAALSPEDFNKIIVEEDVFARLTPSQKESIIKGLRSQGNVVGFMGDGINDAPAMKAADIGISVDTAVDVAKEAADIVLLERSLLVLKEGILEGRRVFSNIIKYIKMGASSNFGNMFSVVGGSLFLPFLPMAPIQILTNNLLYDFSQTAIPTDKVDPEQVEKPQKWDISYIKKFMFYLGPTSSIFDYATFFLMLYGFNCIAFSSAGISQDMKNYYEQLFHTGWFVESLLSQTLIIHIIRTNRIPFIQSRSSSGVAFFSLLVATIGILLPYSPLAGFFGFVPLPLSYWFWISAFMILYIVLTHGVKTFFNKRVAKIA